MVEAYTWKVYKESRTNGCVMEDGADTRKYTSEIMLIPDHAEERYMEEVADEMGYQDYSFQFDTKKIATLTHEHLIAITHKWIMSLELHDIVNDKKKFEEIANKIKHCIEAIENEKV